MKHAADLLAHCLPHHHVEVRANALIVPVEAHDLADVVRTLMAHELPFLMLFATDERKSADAFRMHYVFGMPGEHSFVVLQLTLADTTFPSLAAKFPAFSRYEREAMEMFGLVASGHPDPRSLSLHEENFPRGVYPLRKDFAWNTNVPDTHAGDYEFNVIDGEGIYEIPVGPIHAGIIEPGNFRFSVAGEEIVALEARLGWVHKGVEKLFENLPLEQHTKLAERISGDSSFSHSLAYCQALEHLTDTKVPPRAQHLRLIFAEMERITMHLFDIGNIAGNGTGFSFMAAQGFRMLEDMRRINESLSGSRFLRGINTPGGVVVDISPEQSVTLSHFLASLKRDFADIIDVAESSTIFANRVHGAGVVPAEVVHDLAAVGIAARCNGITKDTRIEYPYGAYKHIAPEIMLTEGGDVEARFYLRVKEVYESMRLIEQALASLPSGSLHKTLAHLPAEGLGVSAVEGWRGEIVYAIIVQDGAITRVKVRDPSFIHWQLFSHLASKDMVPDFPLINKSFNLSYTGSDL